MPKPKKIKIRELKPKIRIIEVSRETESLEEQVESDTGFSFDSSSSELLTPVLQMGTLPEQASETKTQATGRAEPATPEIEQVEKKYEPAREPLRAAALLEREDSEFSRAPANQMVNANLMELHEQETEKRYQPKTETSLSRGKRRNPWEG
jgi:hypothetical protein